MKTRLRPNERRRRRPSLVIVIFCSPDPPVYLETSASEIKFELESSSHESVGLTTPARILFRTLTSLWLPNNPNWDWCFGKRSAITVFLGTKKIAGSMYCNYARTVNRVKSRWRSDGSIRDLYFYARLTYAILTIIVQIIYMQPILQVHVDF